MSISNTAWSNGAMRLVRKLNSFFEPGSSRERCIPLTNRGVKLGILQPKVVESLKNYQEVFTLVKDKNKEKVVRVEFNPLLTSYEARSKAVRDVVLDLRTKDLFETLRYWRDEEYDVAGGPGESPVFKVERAATSLFGVLSYGAHMNGYVHHPDRGICIWIARRSAKKQTFPGMLDNIVAGGIGVGYNIRETMIKECYEEASIPKELAEKAVSVGCISYVYESSRGVSAEVQYCFDLELPLNFQPSPLDGEVEEFMLCDIEQVMDLVIQDNFKPNCAAVTIDFLIRFGFVTPDNVPHYCQIIQGIHNKDLLC